MAKSSIITIILTCLVSVGWVVLFFFASPSGQREEQADMIAAKVVKLLEENKNAGG